MMVACPKAKHHESFHHDQHIEDGDEEGSFSSSESASTVGARGVPLQFGTSCGEESEGYGSDKESTSSDSSEEEDDEVAMLGAAATASNACSETEDDEELDEIVIANIICPEDDEELSVIFQSIKEEEQRDDREEQLIGVAHDRVAVIPVAKPKRLLSYNTLFSLNGKDGGSEAQCKRPRLDFDNAELSTPRLVDCSSPTPEVSLVDHNLQCCSPIVSPGTIEAGEEDLNEALNTDVGHGGKIFIPLLTPPDSPLTVEDYMGNTRSVCEWPSNLVVDVGLTATVSESSVSPLCELCVDHIH